MERENEENMEQELFLDVDATIEQCWQALSLNIQACCERLAGDREVRREGGIMWTYGHVTISAVDVSQINKQIDRLVNWYRRQHPLRGAICWYLAATPPGDLAARLFARGFEPNWQPHWMWCELSYLKKHHAYPSDVSIRLVEDDPVWQVDDLPYYNKEDVAILAALAHVQPRRVWHLAAFRGQQVVGRCFLNVTTGEYGIGGLFSMGVIPAARKQGIGTALAQVACELARHLGCHHVVLNATEMGEPVYRRVGFQSMGYGHTWYLRDRTLAAPAPTEEQVAFLEAVGRGEVALLDEASKRVEERVLHEVAPNGLTPLDIAVRCQQSASAEWLIEHGVRLDLLSAWDLGWKEQIPILLASHPELVNLQRGEWRMTPLHTAIQRDDLELVKLLLTVPHDLSIKDGEFGSTALGWAHYFERPEMIVLIEQHRRKWKP
jgi:GNAT superfamily N-acetyltransferase